MNVTADNELQESSLAEVFTLTLWIIVLAVGIVGYVLPYARGGSPAKKHAAIQAEVLEVQLTVEPQTVAIPNSQPLPVPPELQSPTIQPLSAPALTPVAEPTAVAFAIPVDGPVRIVAPRLAAVAAPAIVEKPVVVAAPAPAPQQLTYGQGEGRQPAPEYPYRARREGQEGTVTVQFSVGENGNVLAAHASKPSAWQLLNDAAVTVVRERWRFKTGPLRTYEVSIRFQLNR